jgi:CubicO group peptidase (beta-lactamase class C family)
VTEQPFHRSVDKLQRPARERIEEIIRTAGPSVAPALAISVWASGAPWYEAYAGWVDPDSRERRVGFDTLFDLASVSKLFTATAFLRLGGDFKVNLEDAVVTVIPEFGAHGARGVDGGQEPLSRRLLPAPPERAEWSVDPAAVTFKHLLTHTSGLAPWRSVFRDAGPVPPAPDRADPTSLEARRSAGLAAICEYPFVARPGEEFHYSDLGFMLLGETVGRLFGAPLEVAMQALVRDRLGIDSLTYAPLRAGRPRERIVPTSFDDDWRERRCWGEVEDENAAGLGGVAGHAGLFASVHDVARFGVAWLRRDPRIRLARYQQAATSDQTGQLTAAHGLGWQVQPTPHLAPFSDASYGHTGFTGTSLVVDPERDLVVAVLTNRVHAGRTHAGIDELRLELHRLVAEAF